MLFFNETEIEKCLPMHTCIGVMKDLFSLNIATETYNPLRQIIPVPNSTGMMGLMPAFIKPYGVMGVKVLSIFPENYKKGLSSHQGIVNLFDMQTGYLLASFDADTITGIRTAAVSGLMTDILAPKNAETLCIMGSGLQAEKHLEAMITVRPIKKVTVWSQNYGNAQAFVKKAEKKYPLSIKAISSAKEAVKDADIICTVTAASTPILFNDWLKKHVHINAVGACVKTKRELDSAILLDSDVFIDNYESAHNEAGDIILAAHEGRTIQQIIKADIHELIKNKDLINPSKKTVFKSLGIAIEDVAAVWYCYNTAIMTQDTPSV